MTAKYNRHSIRLKTWDYSSCGYYFVTIRSHKGECIFGDVVGGRMVLNDNGKVLCRIWNSLQEHHSIGLDAFQVMPNHVHMIIIINNPVGASRGSPKTNDSAKFKPMGGSRPAPTLGVIVGLFKSECTKQIRKMNGNDYVLVWQRNYYERIIRNEKQLNGIREYIQNNPQKWHLDKDNPQNWQFQS